MSTAVDMSLDDIIKKNKGAERGRGRGRGRRGRPAGGSFSGRGASGAVRRGPLGVNARASQYAIAKPSRAARSLPWRNDLLEDSIRAAGITGVEVGTKLYISNLDFGVTNEDVRELFLEIGDIKRYAVHFDKNGRPSGSAEVVYTRRSDAIAAFKKYNNVLLDGKPMKIEILGASDVPVSARVNVTGVNGFKRRTVFMMSGPGRTRGPAPTNRGAGWSQRGGGRGGRGRGRGGGRGGGWSRGGGWGRGGGRGLGRGKKQKSTDQLDKELEKYHSEAMQT